MAWMGRALASVLLTVALSTCSSRTPTGCGAGALAVLSRQGHRAEIAVEIADTPTERVRGLMGRRHLAADRGMAFLFDAPSTERFWMKDTPIPLSIAFWDARGRIVAILDMRPCAADPCPTYGPDAPYVGALEANRGYFQEHDVQVGDRVEIVRDGCV